MSVAALLLRIYEGGHMVLFFRRLPRFKYVAPKSMDEVLSMLSAEPGKTRLLAGGTDLIPQVKRREIDAPEFVVDLKGISGLDTITYDRQYGLKIGALATITAVEQSADIRAHFPILAQAASVMASPQVRNRGTFVGNICNAVPSADSVPSLLALEASVKVKGPKTERVVPLDQFFTGPRKTILEGDEIVMEILVPMPSTESSGTYLKLSPRHSMDLAVVGVAVQATCRNGVCSDVKIGLGAVAPTPVRAPMAEAMLKGQKVSQELIDEAARNALSLCSPIDDHRASAEYRCDMVYVMTRRALGQVLLERRT
jgi:CO/xanthine dehydrogenase FAD-binding subunit